VQYQPPFVSRARDKRQIHEEDELVWDDGVAPETCIDFDAQHISSGEALLWLLGGFGFFGALGTVAYLSDPAGSNPALPRQLPYNGMQLALGLDAASTEQEDE